ncbi:MAG: conjugal transfer protein TraN [Gammaproteobacteria bacterium]
MHIRHTLAAVILGCLADSGEIATCLSTPQGQLCPLDSEPCTQEPTCPLPGGSYCLGGHLCKAEGVCAEKQFGPITYHQCEHSQERFLSFESCQSGCVQQATCEPQPTCPSGGTCMQQNNGSWACSAKTCSEFTATASETVGIDDRVYKDDGRRDEQGMCLDQVMVFAGRNMECRLAGKSTAYRTCCKPFGEIMTDSTGSVSELSAATTTISATYQATKAAFDTYRTTKEIADTADSFSTAFKSAFDPTSLAISVAVSLAIDYFVNNCNEMDMETGILNSSGSCYETGTYCKQKWFGDCVQEAKTYCCFNSKLGRILHEQGRSQLQSFVGESPNNCRGFYAEEFQYLDFSRIDFSEYNGDLKVQPQEDIERSLQEKTDEFIDVLD